MSGRMQARNVVVGLILGLCFGFNAKSQSKQGLDLNTRITSILQGHNVPGAGVALVTKDSVLWLDTLGLADWQKNEAVRETTLFGVGSIAKSFLAAATMTAQERKLVALDDPIHKIVPSLKFTNRWAAQHPVRLVHLLEHTSGFDEAHFDLFAKASAATPFKEVMQRSRPSLNTRWPPGRYYAYNNFGVMVAAHCLEEAVNRPFETYVQENLLLPLGMERATYHPTDRTKPYLAKGYAGTDATEEPFPYLPQWPAGSLVASITDMANFVQMFLNGGKHGGRQILSSFSIEKMETPESSLRARNGVGYGYGKGLRGQLEKGRLFYGHDGSYGGFLAEFGYSREMGVGYVILLNNRDGRKAMKEIKQVLLTKILPEKAPEALPVVPNEPERLERLTGCYQPVAPAMEIFRFATRLADLQFVVEEDGQLFQKSVIGEQQPLLSVGENRFRRHGELLATSVFLENSDGQKLWLDEDTYERIPVWWGYTQFFLAAVCTLTMLLGFLVLLVWIPAKLIKKQAERLRLQVLPMMAVSCLVAMILSLAILYDPLVEYSAGAMLGWIFGWGFLGFSFLSLLYWSLAQYNRQKFPAFNKCAALWLSVSCCIASVYLLYWGVIGLTLWSY